MCMINTSGALKSRLVMGWDWAREFQVQDQCMALVRNKMYGG